ncbi:hypothetical protein [Hyphomonas sp.]|uniref:hypothetical protein n=1 Tax=Hyphomonas sp. TaxID=87 RepID=UPI0025C3C64A|nr:hypothetical protein [Hyphomonas sp.]
MAENPDTGEVMAFDGEGWKQVKAGREMNFMERQLREGNTFTGLVDAAADSFTFGLSDEAKGVAGGVSSLAQGGSFKEGYDKSVTQARDRERKFSEESPALDLTARIVGGLGGTAAITKGATLPAALTSTAPRRVATTLAIGAGEGAVYGFNEGEEDDRLSSAGQGALIGGAMGAVVPPLMHMGAKGLRALFSSVGKKADNGGSQFVQRKVMQALERDGYTPETAAKALDSMGPEARIADLGENTKALLRSMTAMPGEARTTALQALETRGRQTGQRLADSARAATGAKGNFSGQIDDLLTQRKAAAAPLYEAAYKKTVQSDKLASLLKRPSIQDAMKRGVRLAMDEGEDVSALGVQFNQAGDPVFEGIPSMRVLHYVKRGLDDVVSSSKDALTGKLTTDQGRTANELRKQLLDELDRLNPDYKAARASYAGPSRTIEVMEQGRRFARQSEDLTLTQLAKMAPSEKEAFREGVAQGIQDMIDRRQITSNMAKTLFDKPDIRKKLRAVFPSKDALDDFLRQARLEGRFFETRSMVKGGSPTARIQAEMDDMASDTAPVGDLMRAGVEAVAEGGGQAAITAGRGIVKRISDAISMVPETERNAIVRMLTAGGRKRGQAMNRLTKRLQQLGVESQRASAIKQAIAAEIGMLSGASAASP